MKLNTTLLTEYKTVGIACSGGRDSTVLLHALREQGFSCAAVHVNHALRDTADRDEEFVSSTCATLGIPCKVYRAESGQFGASDVENKARLFRKTCYEDAVASGFCDVVATAHHTDDNAETVLLHLLRGSGAKGLCGIPERNGVIVRPMLNCTRDEINAYATAHGIAYCDDETNALSCYDRNFLRNNVIPLLQTRWGEAAKSIHRASKILQDENEFLDSLTPAPLTVDGETVLKDLATLHPVLQMRAIKKALSSVCPYDFESKHVQAVLELVTAQNGTTIDLPHGVRAVNDYGNVTIFRPTARRELCVAWEKTEGEIDGYPVRFGTDTAIPPRPLLCFDAESVPEGAVWRRRREGDVFTPFGGGTRPLKEYLIDKKVSARKRDNLVLLCYNNEVLVIAGIEISRKVQIHKGSRLVATVGTRHV